MSKKSRPWTRQRRKAIRARTESGRPRRTTVKRTVFHGLPCTEVRMSRRGSQVEFIEAILDHLAFPGLAASSGVFVGGPPVGSNTVDLSGPPVGSNTVDDLFAVRPVKLLAEEDIAAAGLPAIARRMFSDVEPLDELTMKRMEKDAVSVEDYEAMMRGEKPWPPGTWWI